MAAMVWMADEINFMDLVTLSRITPDLVVEKFGSKINSSFFDASNILGTLRLKGLIDFTANFPGQSAITVTDLGKQLLNEAADKAKAPFDQVDYAILLQLKAGKRSYLDIGGAVNLRPKDLAMHLYRLSVQLYSVYEVRNGSVEVMLTEKGLMQANSGMPGLQQQQGAPAAPQQQPMAQQPGAQPQQHMGTAPAAAMEPQAGDQSMDGTIEDLEKKINVSKGKARRKLMVVVVVVVVVIVALLLLLHRIPL